MENKIASADSFVVKIWDTLTAETYTNVEPGKSAAINHMHWWQDSGLFFLACDDAKIQATLSHSLDAAVLIDRMLCVSVLLYSFTGDGAIVVFLSGRDHRGIGRGSRFVCIHG